MAAIAAHSIAPILLFLLSLPSVSCLVFNFNFSQSNIYDAAELNIFSLSSTHLNSSVEGSNNTAMIGGSIGQVLYAQPVPLWDDYTSEVASFSMSMAFCLRMCRGLRTSSNSTEARVAFFLGRYDQPSNGTAGDKVMQVEFDACLQEKLDAGEYSVSAEANYIVSKVQVNTTFPGNTNNLSSGCMMMVKAQIDYNGSTKRLEMGIQIDDVSHHINTTVDLRTTLPREVAIGFLSSTGHPIELHNVLRWSFTSTTPGQKNSSAMQVFSV